MELSNSTNVNSGQSRAAPSAPQPPANGSDTPRPRVICFGEMLWDLLPDRRHPGGAPFNVAYHLAHQGCDVHIASAVGNDALGNELLDQLTRWNIDRTGVRVDPALPTGIVRAELDASGNARYEIVRSVAWDAIEPGPATFAAASTARALVFGSLAQRETANRTALSRVVAALPHDALRVFDVNLRAPFDSPELVADLSRHAALLKLNAAEAARLVANATEEAGREEADARSLAKKFCCASIVITAGSRGAGWLKDETWHWAPAQTVKVADTVGAGDGFLAALLAGLLLRSNEGAAALLAHACRTGEWVASRPGATPAYTDPSDLTP